MGTCGQPGYVFPDFCLKQGIDFIIFLSKIKVSLLLIFVLNRVSFLKQPVCMFYELNYSKMFIHYCLTQGMVSG